MGSSEVYAGPAELSAGMVPVSTRPAAAPSAAPASAAPASAPASAPAEPPAPAERPQPAPSRPAAPAPFRPGPVEARAVPAAAPPEKRGSGAVVALVVALVVLVGGAATYFVLVGQPGPASIVGAVAPPEATVTLDGMPVPLVGGRYQVGELEPGRHVLEFSAPGHEPYRSSVEVAAGEAFVVTPVILARSAPPSPTGLAVRVRPEGATIFVDEQPRPETTPTELLAIPEGQHSVRVEKAGYRPLVRTVLVAAGAVATVEGELEPAGVPVTLAALEPSTAACRLTHEGSAPEPVGASFHVDPSRSPTLRCEAEGHEAFEERVVLQPGQQAASLEVRLRAAALAATARPGKSGTPGTPGPAPVKSPAPVKAPAAAGGEGFISVATRPWTKVYMDGRLVGNTPIIRHKVPSGTHRLILMNEDFNIRETLSVQVAAGETKQVVRNMVQ